jgi:hypothetical protein
MALTVMHGSSWSRFVKTRKAACLNYFRTFLLHQVATFSADDFVDQEDDLDALKTALPDCNIVLL